MKGLSLLLACYGNPELAENREAETWKQHWDALVEAGLIEQQTVVSDQGPGLVKGCTLMGLTHHPGECSGYVFMVSTP